MIKMSYIKLSFVQVFAEGDKPSKWWTCFARRKFMDKTLTPLGRQF